MDEEAQYVAEWEAERMANFCVATGFPPEVYLNLTGTEYRAFVEAVNTKNGA